MRAEIRVWHDNVLHKTVTSGHKLMQREQTRTKLYSAVTYLYILWRSGVLSCTTHLCHHYLWICYIIVTNDFSFQAPLHYGLNSRQYLTHTMQHWQFEIAHNTMFGCGQHPDKWTSLTKPHMSAEFQHKKMRIFFTCANLYLKCNTTQHKMHIEHSWD